MKIVRTAIALGFAFVLVGCAGVPTVTPPKNYLEGQEIALVPTGNLRLNVASSTVGSAFGMIGALVEMAITEKSRADSVQQVSRAIGGDFLFLAAQDTVKSNINSLGKPRSIHLASRTLIQQDVAAWFNPETRTDLVRSQELPADIAVDFGFQGLGVSSYLAGTYAEGVFVLRVIDLRTGKVVARARTQGVGQYGGERIRQDKSHADYEAAARQAFDRLVRKLATEAVAKISA